MPTTNLFSNAADRYRRWRHSRGYGIHSPLAYNLVTEALYLRHGYSYYIESDARLDSGKESWRARALYRLAVTLRRWSHRPLAMYMYPGCPDIWCTAARMAGATLTPDRDTAECSILPPDASLPATDTGTGKFSGRLIFRGRHWTIVISGHHMADTLYTLP